MTKKAYIIIGIVILISGAIVAWSLLRGNGTTDSKIPSNGTHTVTGQVEAVKGVVTNGTAEWSVAIEGKNYSVTIEMANKVKKGDNITAEVDESGAIKSITSPK